MKSLLYRITYGGGFFKNLGEGVSGFLQGHCRIGGFGKPGGSFCERVASGNHEEAFVEGGFGSRQGT